MHHMAHGAEFFRGVAANEAVDLNQFFIGEPKIGLADWHKLLAPLTLRPDAKCIIRIVRRTFAMAALGIHQNGIDDMRVALPLPPLAIGAARLLHGPAAPAPPAP